MPSVFNGTTKVPRRVPDPRTDQKLAPGGSLNYGSIATESALSGTTGMDCEKLSGNRWEEMGGDLTSNYTGDKKIDVKGKHTETIQGDQSLTVTSGNLNRAVSAGKVTETVGQGQEVTVGVSYKLQASVNIEQQAGAKLAAQATMLETTASAMATHKAGGIMTVQGTLVKINC